MDNTLQKHPWRFLQLYHGLHKRLNNQSNRSIPDAAHGYVSDNLSDHMTMGLYEEKNSVIRPPPPRYTSADVPDSARYDANVRVFPEVQLSTTLVTVRCGTLHDSFIDEKQQSFQVRPCYCASSEFLRQLITLCLAILIAAKDIQETFETVLRPFRSIGHESRTCSYCPAIYIKYFFEEVHFMT